MNIHVYQYQTQLIHWYCTLYQAIQLYKNTLCTRVRVCNVIHSTITALTLWFTSTSTHIRYLYVQQPKKFFMTQSMPSDIFFTDIYTTRIIQIFHTITSKRYDHEDNNISWMCNKKISLNDFSTDGYEWYTDKIGFKLLYTDPCNKNRFLHIFQLHKLP